jgi:hypothetical protein
LEGGSIGCVLVSAVGEGTVVLKAAMAGSCVCFVFGLGRYKVVEGDGIVNWEGMDWVLGTV